MRPRENTSQTRSAHARRLQNIDDSPTEEAYFYARAFLTTNLQLYLVDVGARNTVHHRNDMLQVLNTLKLTITQPKSIESDNRFNLNLIEINCFGISLTEMRQDDMFYSSVCRNLKCLSGGGMSFPHRMVTQFVIKSRLMDHQGTPFCCTGETSRRSAISRVSQTPPRWRSDDEGRGVATVFNGHGLKSTQSTQLHETALHRLSRGIGLIKN